jgi:hypothetical protein
MLSFAADDVAVPHLKRVAEEHDGLSNIAMEGLVRIGSRSAVRALQGLNGRYYLSQIRRNTKDESLRQEIEAILAKP